MRENTSQSHASEAVDVTPRRPSKKQRTRIYRGRKPDPFRQSSSSHASSSSVMMSPGPVSSTAKKKLTFPGTSNEMVSLNVL